MLQEKIKRAQLELDLVISHIKEQREKADRLSDQRERVQEQAASIAKIIEPLEQQRDKAQMMLQNYGVDVFKFS